MFRESNDLILNVEARGTHTLSSETPKTAHSGSINSLVKQLKYLKFIITPKRAFTKHNNLTFSSFVKGNQAV